MNPEEMMGGQMGGDQMPQEEMRKSLSDMYNKVQQKKRDWDTTKSVSGVRVEEAKLKTLQKFFDSFEKAGIDPSDPEAMRQFFDRLYEKNPDLYELIVPVIDEILGPEQPQTGMEQGGMMGGEVGP